MSESERLLREIHGKMSGIERIEKSIVSLDERQRRSEIVAAEHNVKIERLQDDVDGAFRKIKSVEDRVRIRVASTEHHGRARELWITLLELLVVLPTYWKAVVVIGGIATTLIALSLRAHGVHLP